MRISAWPAIGIATAGALLAPRGWCREEAIATRSDVASVFFIAKSENKNQVHYGIHLDASCAPAGPAPVYAYWRMLEHGPQATEPLLAREVRAYGIAEQRVMDRGPGVARTRVTLAALRTRPILVESYFDAGRCVARARLPVGGVAATLESVFVQLRWPFGVDHLTLWGHALDDGRLMRERVEP